MSDHSNVRRTAIVTGVSPGGIGFEIARQLFLAGHRVALFDLDEGALAAATEALGGASHRLLPVRCDIGRPSDVGSAVGTVRAELGAVGVLVNSAGWAVNRPLLELTDAEIERTIRVNYVGTVEVTRKVLPDMIDARWGRIISISSDAARVGTPRETVYAGAKAAVIGFTKSLCAEVARHGVTVNVLCPGTTDTPLLHAVLKPEQIERRMAANPSGRIALPQDIASAALFFASGESGYINGQVLSISGGITRVG